MNKKIQKRLPMLIVLGLVTCISTYAKMAPDDSFFSHWLSFYALALVIVAPSGMLMMARMNKIVSNLLQDKKLVVQGLAFAVPLVLVMGTLMSGIMTFVFTESETLSQFFSLWAVQLQNSLPIFLTIGIIMGGIIRPLIALRKLKKA